MMNQQGLACRCRTGAPVAHSRIYLQGAGLRVAAPRSQRQQRRVTVMSVSAFSTCSLRSQLHPSLWCTFDPSLPYVQLPVLAALCKHTCCCTFWC